jgi:hypothetical protein
MLFGTVTLAFSAIFLLTFILVRKRRWLKENAMQLLFVVAAVAVRT